MRIHDTLTKAIIAVSACFILSCQQVELPEMQEHKIVASVGAYNTKANFHTTETPNVLCEWNGRETLRVYYKKSNGKYHSLFANAPVAKIEEGGKSAAFTYYTEPEWGLDGKDNSYPVAIFTVNCVPTIDPEDGSIYLDARLIRQPLKDFELPVYYVGEVVDGSIEATFSHYYAYEFLHVKNLSDKSIDFSLNGYDTPWIWYKKLASVGLEDGVVYNKSWSGLTPAEVSYPVSIAPGSSDIIVSAYIPNDFIIKDASIVATIDGNVVKSTNKKSSAAPLVPGRAYHMYATWDGNELKFIDNGSAAGTISVEEEKIEFGDVFVDETGTEYLTIHNNGTAEQKVKVSIEDYTFSSPFDLPGAELGDGYVYKVVPAGGSRSVALSFRASSPDDYDGNAIVSLDGSDKVECIVPLHGKSIAKPDEDSFHLSKNSIEIYVHTMMNVRIRNGSGDYDVVNENPDIVDYEIRIYSTSNSPATRSPGDTGGKITDDFWEITGKKVGEATLRLADKKTKEELTLHVKVEPSPELTLARHDVELAVAERSSVEVLTGSDWYDITIDNPSVVSANFVTISSVGGSSIYEDDRPSSGIFVMLEGLSVGQTTVRVKDMSSYEEATIQVTVAGGLATPEIVDLGLPSGLKWASFNLGASKPEEIGDYYAWGETEPYYSSLEEPLAFNPKPIWKPGKENGYNWHSYKWIEGDITDESYYNNYFPLTKYCNDSSCGYNGFTDGKSILDSEDDPAVVKLGGRWRMPTKEDLEELILMCNWEWTSVNGMVGRRVIGPNGNSIFLPAAGTFNSENRYLMKLSGHYLSSSLHASEPYYMFRLQFGEGYSYLDTNRYRSFGYSVRPVYDDSDVKPEIKTPEPVDLGLPSGLKWASFNLGASKPEEYGDYYAWGETEPYYVSQNPLIWKDGKEAGYDWSSYKWCLGSFNTMNKYCNVSFFGNNGFTDGKTVLVPEDDAAHVNLGGDWRMPTDAEWAELREKCTWTWTTRNGVNGRLFTGSNGNSIFIPAAGYRDGTNLSNVGSDGLYWSSSLYMFNSCHASYAGFHSGDVYRYEHFRYYGNSVRPVYGKPNHSGGSEPSDGNEGGPAGPPVGPDNGDDGDL